MNPAAFIFDCDPGADDAVELLMAMACPEVFQILGITTVGGNVDIERVTHNTLSLCTLAGREDIPVFQGCPRPLVAHPTHAIEAHGETGIGGAILPQPQGTKHPKHAVNFLIDQLSSTTMPITLVCSAPLTNMAVALTMAPHIKANIQEILIMGGALTSGNITAAAEFNFFCDPHAAHVVLASGVPITLIGLDITHKVCATPKRLDQLRALNSEVGREVAAMLETGLAYDQENFGLPGRAIHDACLSAYVLRPDLFKTKRAHVHVETQSQENQGACHVSFYPRFLESTATQVVYEADGDGIFDVILTTLGRYS